MFPNLLFFSLSSSEKKKKNNHLSQSFHASTWWHLSRKSVNIEREGWRTNSVDTMFAMQVWGPEFNPQVWCGSAVHPRARRESLDYLCGSLDSQSNLKGKLQRQWDSVWGKPRCVWGAVPACTGKPVSLSSSLRTHGGRGKPTPQGCCLTYNPGWHIPVSVHKAIHTKNHTLPDDKR